jgi:hypothetical protein
MQAICQCGCGQPIPFKKHHKKTPAKFIKGHSNRVRKIQHKSNEERFWKRVKKVDNGCWEWTGYIMPNGYGNMKVRRDNGILVNEYAHRFSYEIHKGPIPEGMYVCHKCDNRKCVNPEHLFIGTQKDNIHDMDRKGRRVVRPGTQKITRKDAENIRLLHRKGVHVDILAEKYGLKPCTIRNIIAYRLWKNEENHRRQEAGY